MYARECHIFSVEGTIKTSEEDMKPFHKMTVAETLDSQEFADLYNEERNYKTKTGKTMTMLPVEEVKSYLLGGIKSTGKLSERVKRSFSRGCMVFCTLTRKAEKEHEQTERTESHE